MWKTIIENTKLVVATLLLVSTLMAGTWTMVTSLFVTKAEAQEFINRLDIDTSYNKAFRLESKISKLMKIQKERTLSSEEKRALERYQKDLQRVDNHIAELEHRLYSK